MKESDKRARRILAYQSLLYLRDRHPNPVSRKELFNDNSIVLKFRAAKSEQSISSLSDALKNPQWQKSYLNRMVECNVLERITVDDQEEYKLTTIGQPLINRWIEEKELYGGREFAWFTFPREGKPPSWLDRLEGLEEEDEEENEENEEENEKTIEFPISTETLKNIAEALRSIADQEKRMIAALADIQTNISNMQKVQEEELKDSFNKFKKRFTDLEKQIKESDKRSLKLEKNVSDFMGTIASLENVQTDTLEKLGGEIDGRFNPFRRTIEALVKKYDQMDNNRMFVLVKDQKEVLKMASETMVVLVGQLETLLEEVKRKMGDAR